MGACIVWMVTLLAVQESVAHSLVAMRQLPRVGAAGKCEAAWRGGGVRSLIKQPHITPVVQTGVLRRSIASARRNFKSSPEVLERARHSLVQVSLPHHTSVLGTGFVLKSQKKLWIVMPYHLAGAAGGTRVVRVQKQNGEIVEQEVPIVLNGTAGWHSPDVALAELPPAWANEVTPLEMAPVDTKQEVYSVGYVAGELGMGDLLPVTSRLFYVDRENMLRAFHIPGSTIKNPISGNGYCGTPLLQKVGEEWKVVGMHNGHVMDLKNPSASVGSSVNLHAALPQLMDNYESPMAMRRGLVFRGWEITRLDVQERVDTITVERADSSQEPIVRYLRNFAEPYSDAHAELALGDIDLQQGDKLIFSIIGRTEHQRRVQRQVEFVIP